MSIAQNTSQLVMTACTQCHTTQQICAQLGIKDKAGWIATVNRMITMGAQVTPQQQPAVVDWIASQSQGSSPLCN